MRHHRQTLLTLVAMLLVAATGVAPPQEGLTIAHGPYLQQLTESSVMIVWRLSCCTR